MRRVVVDVIDFDHDRRFVRPVHVTVVVRKDAVDCDGQSVRGDRLAIERRAGDDDAGAGVDREHGRVQLIAEVGERRRVAVDGDNDAGEGADGDVLRQSEGVSPRDELRLLVVDVDDSDEDQGVL